MVMSDSFPPPPPLPSTMQDVCDLTCFLSADGRLDKGDFLNQWKSIAAESRTDIQGLSPAAENVEAVCPKFEVSKSRYLIKSIQCVTRSFESLNAG